MKSIQNKIAEIKTNGYNLNFGDVLDHAFENYKKIALYAGLMLLVFTVLFGFVLVAVAVSFFDMETITEGLKQESLNSENLPTDFVFLYRVGRPLPVRDSLCVRLCHLLHQKPLAQKALSFASYMVQGAYSAYTWIPRAQWP